MCDLSNACHHQATEIFSRRGYPLVAALVNGIVSGHLCGYASTLVDVRDEKVQR
jgi:hypothetical protein